MLMKLFPDSEIVEVKSTYFYRIVVGACCWRRYHHYVAAEESQDVPKSMAMAAETNFIQGWVL